MATITETIQQVIELTADTQHMIIRQPLVRGDKKAHTFQLTVTNNGSAATLTGCTASLAVVRADGATATVAGTVSGNKVTYTLPPACYLYAGQTQLYFRLITGDYTRTVLWMTANVVTADTDTIVADNTTTLPSIDEFNSVLSQCQNAASTAQTAAASVAAYPYTTVQGYAQSAEASKNAAAESAAAAAASSGIPEGGSTGDILMKTATSSTWSGIISELQEDIANAGHTFVIRTVTIASADAPAPAAHQISMGNSVSVSVESGAIVVPISGRPAATMTYALLMTGLTATVYNTTATINYDIVNASASTVGKRDWVITYLVIY